MSRRPTRRKRKKEVAEQRVPEADADLDDEEEGDEEVLPLDEAFERDIGEVADDEYVDHHDHIDRLRLTLKDKVW